MAEDDDEGFADFKFAPPSLSHAGSDPNFTFTFNGSFATSQPQPQQQPPPADANSDDDDWGDFMSPPSRPSGLCTSNGFSSSSLQTTATAFVPFGSRNSSSDRLVQPRPIPIDSQSKGVAFEKPRGPLPLSLFGEEEEEGVRGEGEESGGSVGDFPLNGSNGFLQSQAVVNGNSSNLKVGASEILANLYAQSLQIKYESGLNSNSNGLHMVSKTDMDPSRTKEGFDDGDDWEFCGAFSENGSGENFKERRGTELSGSKGESIAVIIQDQKADASKFVMNNLGSTNGPHQFADAFTTQNKVSEKDRKVSNGTDFRATTFYPDGFRSFPFANGMEGGNINTVHPIPESIHDDFDDFGEFIDAASEPGSKHQNYHALHEASAEVNVQDGNVVDHNTRPQSHKQPHPLPDSIFSDQVVESNDDRNITDGPKFAPRNGINLHGSEKSIQDIISNLYNQHQLAPSVDSSKKPAENGSYPSQKTLNPGLVNDHSYFDKHWEFSDEGRVTEKSSVPGPNDMVQKSKVELQDLQIFIDFYARLRDKLSFLASFLLEDTLDSEAQEARIALQDDMESEVHLEKNTQPNGCLSEFIQVLHGPKLKLIESEYHFSRRLPLAEKDWKVAIKLLKETRLILNILASSSGNDHSAYISTWSNIVNACAKELKHGALIWKQAVENNLQIQILSNHRGQQYIRALGEIYRVVQLLGLSAKVYKPWMLLSKGDQFSIFLILDECSSLWSSSGLEEAFWNLLGTVDDSASGNNIEALLESIRHIQEIDVLAVQDCALLQLRSICQLSLLPEQMLPELKLVSWNEGRFFLNVANFWANLISHDPPILPKLKVG